jgi:unsaturated rhamnogalacturonyl hydrolase
MPSTTDPTLAAVFRRTLALYLPAGAALDPAASTPGTNLNAWDWGPGITLYALQKSFPYVDAALQQAYFDFFRGWFGEFLDKKPPTPAINSAILLNVLWLSVHDPAMPLSGEERAFYKNYCLERVAFYRQHAIKLPGGVFAHTVATGSPASKSQVWADNLFMLVLLLAQVAVTEGDRLLFGEMAGQLEMHYRCLSDPATGLLFHGWQALPENSAGGHLNGAFPNGALWGRGNGWAALGAATLLELAHTPAFGNFKRRIERASLLHFEALRLHQRPDGFWSTLIDRPASYPETSATAAISAAFLKGNKLGWLSSDFEKAGRRGLAAVRSVINPGGEVAGVSGSTPLLDSLAAYEKVPHDRTFTWGQGLGLLVLLETSSQ